MEKPAVIDGTNSLTTDQLRQLLGVVEPGGTITFWKDPDSHQIYVVNDVMTVFKATSPTHENQLVG